MLDRCCVDCHSGRTYFPIYSWILPSGALVCWDVQEGRQAWNMDQVGASDWQHCLDQIEADLMPPQSYRLLHPKARVDPLELQELQRYCQSLLPQKRKRP